MVPSLSSELVDLSSFLAVYSVVLAKLSVTDICIPKRQVDDSSGGRVGSIVSCLR